ncbi:MAG: aminopeptidase, partial [Bdellovibrionales bacterium]|nr:aminopeptidase [Bdellovibrionales bacterium]
MQHVPASLGSFRKRARAKNLRDLLILAALTPFLHGCLATYLVKSSYHQVKLLSSREPLENVLKMEGLSEETKRKLQLAQSAKVFAETNLGLTPTDNYNSFVNIDRPYVTYIVRVAEYDRLKGRNWWYPIVGSLPYKGFFSKEEAIEEAKSFDPKKYDTYVRGATAYSTLGWFDDPILSSMLGYQDAQLINLIIHESVHATIYIKGQADFNERLATFLGDIGTEKYYLSLEGEGSPTVARIKKENEDKKIFSEFMSRELKDLKTWYLEKKQFSDEEKTERLKAIQEKFTAETLPKLQIYKYTSFINAKLNNAQLLSYSTYVADLSDFEKIYQLLDYNFEKLISYCKSLENAKDPSLQLKEDIK